LARLVKHWPVKMSQLRNVGFASLQKQRTRHYPTCNHDPARLVIALHKKAPVTVCGPGLSLRNPVSSMCTTGTISAACYAIPVRLPDSHRQNMLAAPG
jgi:hypothetical protein